MRPVTFEEEAESRRMRAGYGPAASNVPSSESLFLLEEIALHSMSAMKKLSMTFQEKEKAFSASHMSKEKKAISVPIYQCLNDSETICLAGISILFSEEIAWPVSCLMSSSVLAPSGLCPQLSARKLCDRPLGWASYLTASIKCPQWKWLAAAARHGAWLSGRALEVQPSRVSLSETQAEDRGGVASAPAEISAGLL